MQQLSVLSLALLVCLTAIALPGLAQVPTETPTATPTGTVPAPTATPTATPTPPAAAVSFDQSSVAVGDPVTASGSAANGSYCLCMVPEGTFTIGSAYGGTPVACVDLTISTGTFSSVSITPSSPAGRFDLLLLSGACGSGGVILAGQFLDERFGLEAAAAAENAIPGLNTTGVVVLLALIATAGAILLWRRF